MFENVQALISWIEAQKRITPKVSLERFRKISKIYGSPEKNLKYIHIGGTNGKGSTVTFVKNILQEAGFNIGSYISPYVIVFNERIAYNDQYIADEDLLEIGNFIISKYSLLDELGLVYPSFFEFITLLAFIYFSKHEKLDFVVLEVGLGGLLDATNIVRPLVSVVTNISYDHMNVLGNTLVEIAENKLGIVKRGIPFITLDSEELRALIKNKCANLESPLTLVREEDIFNVQISLEGTSFDYQDLSGINLSLLGRHQTRNAALAIEVIRELQKEYLITEENIYQGLKKSSWPGRLQLLSKEPIILLDGAHNQEGIHALAVFLKEVKAGNYLRIVFAVSHDKAKEVMLPFLEEVADEMVFSRYSYRRSDNAEKLFELSHHQNKRVEEDLAKLLIEAIASKNVMTVFCGSLYFISDVLNNFSLLS
ncbi:MAG: bifunctional folylpolyglutamate synthase/dihydrofolate synthase [Bacilli bacterium]|nr:bifunctional folylpolyglutamate synthase/dihydrofolate synthase [Bacilli bacterium]